MSSIEMLMNKLYTEIESVKKDYDIEKEDDVISIEVDATVDEKNNIFEVLRELELNDVFWTSEEKFNNKNSIEVCIRMVNPKHGGKE